MPDVVSAASDGDAIIVTHPVVGCDGDGGGALGHPLVYLRIAQNGDVVCPYCSRRFVLAEGAGTAAGHH